MRAPRASRYSDMKSAGNYGEPLHRERQQDQDHADDDVADEVVGGCHHGEHHRRRHRPRRPRVHRPGARRQRHHTRTRRFGSDGNASRARARRHPRSALEGRAGHPDRRPAAGARRAVDPAAAFSRGGGGRALRRESAAPASTHPDRRHAHGASRAVVREADRAGHRGFLAARAPEVSRQSDRDRSRPGACPHAGRGAAEMLPAAT